MIGAGILGLPESVPFLIEQMHDPSQARIAGHAFCTITGVKLDEDDLIGKPVSEACLAYTFKHGSQVIRRGVALEQVLSGQCSMLPNTNKCLELRKRK